MIATISYTDWYMKNEDLLSILVTFLMGLVAGAYLYLSQGAPLESRLSTPDSKSSSEFVVIGETYGSCEKICPSFRIEHNGSYRYLHAVEGQSELELSEGVLTFSLLRDLKRFASSEVLVEQSQEASDAECVMGDGVGVRYSITLEGDLYLLDSCGTSVDLDSDLWKTLNEIWSYSQKKSEPEI